MRESPGKTAARRFLFGEDCLGGWLSEEQIVSGHHLLLLGSIPHEIRFLDRYGVPRPQIVSIERTSRVYREQHAQNLGVSLFRGEATEFLGTLLHYNHAFVFMNLDVEGSFRSQLDPAMTSVLLFCWRNPATVVATYSSIGRDYPMLWEGVRSLACFLAMLPRETGETVEALLGRYRASGFTEPFNMVLRDLFWLRSVFEASAVASGAVGAASLASVHQLVQFEQRVWEEIRTARRVPLRWRFLCEKARGAIVREDALPRLEIALADLRQIVYNAAPPWSQRCYFAKFRLLERGIGTIEWLRGALSLATKIPLIHINRSGDRADHAERERILGQSVVWPNKRLYDEFVPRQLRILSKRPDLAGIARTILAVQNQRRMAREEAQVANGKLKEKQIQFMRDGRLTDDGREVIRKLAGRGLSTEDIRKLVPASVPRQSIVAHVAVAHRSATSKKPKK